MKKRDRGQIVKSILLAAMGEQVTITTLMNKANLSTGQMKEYLTYCIEKGLLDCSTAKNNKFLYRATPKGVRFIRTAESIQDFFLKSQGLNSEFKPSR